MNATRYRLIFNKKTRALCPVAECVVSRSDVASSVGETSAGSAYSGLRIVNKTLSWAIAMALLLPWSVSTFAQTLPTGGQVGVGAGSIQQSGAMMNIHQQSQKMGINWQSYNIGAGNTVNYQQPNAQAIALNRVIGNSRSEIYGNLNANGKVFLINQNGILFGRNAQINVGGLLATTKNMSDEDFMNEQYHLLGNSASEIINQGNLHAENGAIVLAADTIKNTGTITTPNGRVILAAGQQLNLSIDTFGDIQVGVTQSTLDALIENKGLIAADNGEVYLTARGKEMVNKNAINLEGVIQAKAGKVVIDGDNADDSGNVVLNNGRIDISNDGVENNGKAGSLTVIGKNIGLFGSSTIKADGKYGGGTVLIGGDYLGTGDIPHAQAVVMQKNASIEASATDRGKGGKVILWSDQYTGFFGNINAKGGENGGDGGFVETSSKNKLSVIGGRVDAGATDGATGKWLLDPGNVTIGNSTVNTSLATQTAPDISTASGVKIWEGNTSTDSVVLDTDINNALNADTDVEIKTGAGDYDINVLIGTNISKTVGGAANLTLNASNDIIFEAGTGTSDYIYINSSSGALNIDLQAAGEVSIPGNNTVSFKTNNGDLTVNAANVSLVGDMSLPVHTVMTLNVGTGQANITASDTFSLGYLATSTNDFALNLTTIGNINFTGGKSLYIMNTSAISQDGTLLLKALNERGLTLGGSSSWNATQNSLIHFQGHTNHTRGEGVTLSSPGMTTYGDISITGTSNTGVGVIIYSSINMNNGTVNITGESTSDDGINIKGVHLNGNNQTYINIDGTTSNSTASGVKISRSSITSGGLNITARNNTANTTNASALHFVRDDARYDDSINVLNGGNLLIALNGSAFFGHNKTNVDGNITLIGHKSTSGVAADIDFSAEYDTLHANGLGGINIDTDGNITDMRRMNATAGDIKVVASGNLGFDDNRLHANASGNITLVAGNGTAAGTTDGITGEIQNVDKVLLSSTGTGRTINLYTGGHSLSAANTSVLNDMRVALSNQMTGSINYNAAYGATPGNASSTFNIFVRKAVAGISFSSAAPLNKTYDGTTSVATSVTPTTAMSGDTFVGTVGAIEINADHANQNVGTYTTNNYTLPSNVNLVTTHANFTGGIYGYSLCSTGPSITVNVVPREVTAWYSRSPATSSKTYDGTNALTGISVNQMITSVPNNLSALPGSNGASFPSPTDGSFEGGSVTHTGVVAGEDLGLTSDYAFDQVHAGTNVGINVNNIALANGTNALASNYKLVHPNRTAHATSLTSAQVGLRADILKRDITITANAGLTKTYGDDDATTLGRAFTITAATANTGLVGTDSITGNMGRASGETVGNYNFTTGSLHGGNTSHNDYNLTINTTNNYTITKKTLSYSIPNFTKTYGDDDPTLGTNSYGFHENLTMAAIVEGADMGNVVNRAIFSFNDTGAYTSTSQDDTANVAAFNQLPATVKDSHRQYQNVGQYLASTFMSPSTTLVGDRASNYEAPRYWVLGRELYYIIKPKELTISAITAVNKTYDGTDSATLQGTLNGLVNHAVRLTTVSFLRDSGVNNQVFKSEEKQITGTNVALVVNNASFANEHVGTGIAVTSNNLTLSGSDAGNYVLSTTAVTGNANITQRDITITADANLSKVYGDSDSVALGTSYKLRRLPTANTGLVGADSITGNMGRASGETVGTYNFTKGSLHVGNTSHNDYNLIFEKDSYNITKYSMLVTVSNQNKRFGDNDPSAGFPLTANPVDSTVSSFNESGAYDSIIIKDQITGNIGRQAGETVGLYDFTQGNLNVTDAAGNAVFDSYDISFTLGQLNITPALLTPTIVNPNKMYGEDDPTMGNIAVTLTGIPMSTAVQAYNATGSYANVNLPAQSANVNATVTGLTRSTGEAVGNYTISAGNVDFTNTNMTNYYQLDTLNVTGLKLEITPRLLTITGVTVDDKTYDGTDSATFNTSTTDISGIVNRTVNSWGGGTESIDDTTSLTLTASNATGAQARFSDANAGTNKTIIVNNITLTLTGASAANYSSSNTQANVTANIFKRDLTITANAASKVYGADDQTADFQNYTHTSASYDTTGNITNNIGLVTGDTISGSMGRNVGEHVSSYDFTKGSLKAGATVGSDNYNITINTASQYEITKRDVTVTLNTTSKKYGENDMTLGVYGYTHNFTDSITVGYVNQDGIYQRSGSANLNLTGTAGRTGDENVGNYTVQNVDLSDSNFNIAFVNGSLSITAADLEIAAQSQDKVYDGTTNVSSATAYTATGLLNNVDMIYIDTSGAQHNTTQTDAISAVNLRYNTARAGTDHTITPSNATITSGASNYNITYTTNTGTISPRSVTVEAIADTKTYDGTIDSSKTPTVVSGLLTGDTLTNLMQSFESARAGSQNLVVNITNIAVDPASSYGSVASDYAFVTSTPVVGSIERKQVVVATMTDTKTYDGTIDSSKTPTVVSGLLTGDTLTNLMQSFESARAGSQNLVVNITNIAVDPASSYGSVASDYAFVTSTPVVGSIERKQVVVAATTDTKTYDGTIDSSKTPTVVSGLLTGDTLTNLMQSFESARAGSQNLVVNITNIAVDPASSYGSVASDYAFVTSTPVVGSIERKQVVVAATTDTKTYDGTIDSSKTPTVLSGLLAGDTLTSLTQSFNSSNVQGANGSRLTANVNGYGVQSLTYGSTTSDYEVQVSTTEVLGTIHKKTLLVRLKPTSVKYGETYTPSYEYDGLVGSDSASSLGIALMTLTLDTEKEGKYTLTPKVSNTSAVLRNYDLSLRGAEITVLEQAIQKESVLISDDVRDYPEVQAVAEAIDSHPAFAALSLEKKQELVRIVTIVINEEKAVLPLNTLAEPISHEISGGMRGASSYAPIDYEEEEGSEGSETAFSGANIPNSRVSTKRSAIKCINGAIKLPEGLSTKNTGKGC